MDLFSRNCVRSGLAVAALMLSLSRTSLADESAPAVVTTAFRVTPLVIELTGEPGSLPGVTTRDLYVEYTPAALQDPGAYAGSASSVLMIAGRIHSRYARVGNSRGGWKCVGKTRA